MRVKSYIIAVISLSVGTTGCISLSSSPQSFLPNYSQPIVNIESQQAKNIAVKAYRNAIKFINLTDQQTACYYKVFWYDKNSITQTSVLLPEKWIEIALEPKEQRVVELRRPTKESEGYRIYIK